MGKYMQGFFRAVSRFSVTSVFLLMAACAALQPDLHEVADWRMKADKAYEDKHYDEALYYYNKLSKRVPQEAEIWFRLGNTYARKDDTESAVKAYREAVVRDKQYSKAWYNAGLNQLRASAHIFAESMQYLQPNDPVYQAAKAYNDSILKLMEEQNRTLANATSEQTVQKPIDVEKVEMIVLKAKSDKFSDAPSEQAPVPDPNSPVAVPSPMPVPSP